MQLAFGEYGAKPRQQRLYVSQSKNVLTGV